MPRRSPPNRRWTIFSKTMYGGHPAAVDVVHESWLPPQSHSPMRKKSPCDQLIVDDLELDIVERSDRIPAVSIADLGDEGYGEIIPRQGPGQGIRHKRHARPRWITCFGDQEESGAFGLDAA